MITKLKFERNSPHHRLAEVYTNFYEEFQNKSIFLFIFFNKIFS